MISTQYSKMVLPFMFHWPCSLKQKIEQIPDGVKLCQKVTQLIKQQQYLGASIQFLRLHKNYPHHLWKEMYDYLAVEQMNKEFRQQIEILLERVKSLAQSLREIKEFNKCQPCKLRLSEQPAAKAQIFEYLNIDQIAFAIDKCKKIPGSQKAIKNLKIIQEHNQIIDHFDSKRQNQIYNLIEETQLSKKGEDLKNYIDQYFNYKQNLDDQLQMFIKNYLQSKQDIWQILSKHKKKYVYKRLFEILNTNHINEYKDFVDCLQKIMVEKGIVQQRHKDAYTDKKRLELLFNNICRALTEQSPMETMLQKQIQAFKKNPESAITLASSIQSQIEFSSSEIEIDDTIVRKLLYKKKPLESYIFASTDSEQQVKAYIKEIQDLANENKQKEQQITKLKKLTQQLKSQSPLQQSSSSSQKLRGFFKKAAKSEHSSSSSQSKFQIPFQSQIQFVQPESRIQDYESFYEL